MNKVKNVFLGILKFISRSISYTCFALGAFYIVAVISGFLGYLDFNFSFFQNASSEELKLMLKLILRNFITIGISFAILEYSYKYLIKPCKISFHKLKPTGKANEVKKGESNE